MAKQNKPQNAGSAPGPLMDSVVLLSNMNKGICGTGFITGQVDGSSYVYTCDHVVDDLGGAEQVWVMDRKADVVFSGKAHGVDIAVVRAEGLHKLLKPLAVGQKEPRPGSRFSLGGFHQLHANSDKYLGAQIFGKIGRRFALQSQLSGYGVASWELLLDAKSPYLQPGNSGAPVVVDNNAVAIASHAFSERKGLAIGINAIVGLWQMPSSAMNVSEPATPEAFNEWGESPPEGPNPEDPEKGRWGGRAEANGLKLFVVLTEIKKRHFYFDAIIAATDGQPVGGPARFHLHPTYPRGIIGIKKVQPNNTLQLREVYAEGTYTIGAEIYRGGTIVKLEFDLDDAPGMPQRFKEI